MRRVLREFKPDILNPHCPPGHSYSALVRLLQGSRVPLIRTIADPRPPQRNPINFWLHRHHTDGVLFTTQSSLRRYENTFNQFPSRAKVILPGFRARDFSDEIKPSGLRQRLGLKETDLLAGVIARMSPEKGQEVLLEALSLLEPSERESVFVVIAGEDSRERGHRDLQALAERFGVHRRIQFLGKLDDVRPTMAELDVGIITSTRSEAICRVGLEYMSFGKPVITSDVNILPEVVQDGVSGWTFRNRDAHGLAKCLRDCLHHPDKRRSYGERGREIVRGALHLDHEVEETLAFYQEVMAAKRRTV